MSRRAPILVLIFAALEALLPSRLLAEDLLWNWTVDRSYQFEQSIVMAVYFVDDNWASRDQIEFSQQVGVAAHKITDGARLTFNFSEPQFQATNRANRRTRKFDSKDNTSASHPLWRAVQSDVAALGKTPRVAAVDRKGRMVVVSGLARYPKLAAISNRGLLGGHSEALLSFSTPFLPKNAVQAGDTWKVELPDAFKEMLELKEPIAKATWSAEAKFDKVVTRWKRDHASISYVGTVDLASKKDPKFPFAQYTLSGSFLWDLEKGLEVESDMTIRYAIHPALAAEARKERFWFSITSTAKQRLVKVKPL